MDEKLFENRINANLVCRLCVKTLILEYAIAIFENNDSGFNIQQLIVKYLQLELSADDPISASICQDCLDHLEDFHGFYRNIEQKQKTLENRTSFDFFEVKCESLDDGEDSFSENLNSQEEDFLSTKHETPLEAFNLIASIKAEENNYSSEDDTPLNKLYNISDSKQAREKSLSDEGLDELKPKQVTKTKKKKKYKSLEERPKFQPSEQSLILEDCELSCELCQTVIGNYTELSSHFSKEHLFKKVYIKCCGRLYTGRKAVGRHMHRHRDPDKFKCPLCDKQLASTTYLKAHIRIKHDLVKLAEPIKCEICGKDFNMKKCYQKHMRYHQATKEKQPANCDQCSRSFSSETRLKQHRKIMHGIILPYPCDACSESFLTKEEEETHRSVCKNRKLAQKAPKDHGPEEASAEEFVCKICCKLFPSAHGLRAHIASIHENIHNFICDQCGKKFKLKTSLEKHQLMHQGIVESPAQCQTCGRWLKSQSSLRVHQYIHDNSFNKCSLCDHISTTRRALKLHVRKVHRTEHNFHCQYCEKSFKNSTYLEEHLAIHTGAQLYACPHCHKESRSRSNMYAHVKRMHPEEWLKKQLARSNDPHSTQSHLIKL